MKIKMIEGECHSIQHRSNHPH